MHFQSLARPHCLRGHGEKTILQQGLLFRFSQCVPWVQNPGILQTHLRSPDVSYRENIREQMFGCGFAFPAVWHPSEWLPPEGKLRLKHDLHASALSSVWLSAHRMLGKLCSCEEEMVSTESVFSGLYLAETLASRPWDLQPCPEDLTSRVRAVCLPAISEPCKPIPRPSCDCPEGSRLWECVWQCWAPYCGYLVEVTCQCNWTRH